MVAVEGKYATGVGMGGGGIGSNSMLTTGFYAMGGAGGTITLIQTEVKVLLIINLQTQEQVHMAKVLLVEAMVVQVKAVV